MRNSPVALSKAFRALTALIAVLVTVIAVSAITAPGRLRAFPGRVALLPIMPMVHVSGPQEQFSVVFRNGRGVGVQFPRPGNVRLELSLWGWLHLRPLVVEVVPPLKLVPGGQAIGVMLAPEGLVVERTLPVRDAFGRVRYPAQEAGLKAGDVIVAVDGRPMATPEQLAWMVAEAARDQRSLQVSYLRDGRRRQTRLTPSPVEPMRGDAVGPRGPDSRWSQGAGLLVRDPAIGVGTLTFYDPHTRRFGALGHMVVEPSRRPVTMPDGRIVRAAISSITTGNRGRPGEKVGAFRQEEGALGVIERNTPVGIFGRLLRQPPPGVYTEGLPVALDGHVQEGPATALTVLSGERVESFAIEILRVRSLGVPESQRLVIRVTDPELLARAGGIVQGMSGSPIIQDGYLVGAITHVAVQDPTRGFGVLIEPMVEASGLWKPVAGPRAALTNTQVAA